MSKIFFRAIVLSSCLSQIGCGMESPSQPTDLPAALTLSQVARKCQLLVYQARASTPVCLTRPEDNCSAWYEIAQSRAQTAIMAADIHAMDANTLVSWCVDVTIQGLRSNYIPISYTRDVKSLCGDALTFGLLSSDCNQKFSQRL